MNKVLLNSFTLIMFIWLGAAGLALAIVYNSPRYAPHEQPDVVLSRENEYLRLSGKWTRCDPELDENGWTICRTAVGDHDLVMTLHLNTPLNYATPRCRSQYNDQPIRCQLSFSVAGGIIRPQAIIQQRLPLEPAQIATLRRQNWLQNRVNWLALTLAYVALMTATAVLPMGLGTTTSYKRKVAATALIAIPAALISLAFILWALLHLGYID